MLQERSFEANLAATFRAYQQSKGCQLALSQAPQLSVPFGDGYGQLEEEEEEEETPP